MCVIVAAFGCQGAADRGSKPADQTREGLERELEGSYPTQAPAPTAVRSYEL